jgi:hypothetical protein
MTPKEKAEALYVSALIQHGKDKAKVEALNTAVTVRTLVPTELRDYWGNVVDNLRKRE